MRYFLIEAGPVREEAEALRDHYITTMRALKEWSHKTVGQSEFYHDYRRLIGFARKPQGEGWKQDRKQGFWSPKVSTKEGKALAAEMAQLPRLPDLGLDFFGEDVIGKMIGWDSGALRRAWMLWSEDRIAIVLTATDFFGGTSEEGLRKLMAFQPPEGLREISENAWKLQTTQAEADAKAAHSREGAQA
ncbi:MAG: hypothetical protein LDL26_03440 [Caenispirillum bisanense]|nr:hypothetical protein [Caenispirillum bisanense]MCA1972580.1 hypothetical protein [Caenispirillum sp.]